MDLAVPGSGGGMLTSVSELPAPEEDEPNEDDAAGLVAGFGLATRLSVLDAES